MKRLTNNRLKELQKTGACLQDDQIDDIRQALAELLQLRSKRIDRSHEESPIRIGGCVHCGGGHFSSECPLNEPLTKT